MVTWPATADELIELQQALGDLTPERWEPPTTLRGSAPVSSALSGSKGLVPPVTPGSPGQR